VEEGTAVYRLRDWRRRRLLSVRELASKSGVAKRTVEQAETGRAAPRGATARKLSAALDVRPEQVIEFRRAMGLTDRSDQNASNEGE
jgi:transcriptional regulator with XRE-family HTH domain